MSPFRLLFYCASLCHSSLAFALVTTTDMASPRWRPAGSSGELPRQPTAPATYIQYSLATRLPQPGS